MKDITKRSLMTALLFLLITAFTTTYFTGVTVYGTEDKTAALEEANRKEASPLRGPASFEPITVTVRLEDCHKTILPPTEVTIDKLFIDRGDGYWSDVSFEEPMAFLALQKVMQNIGVDPNDKTQFDCGDKGDGWIKALGPGWEKNTFKLIVNNQTADNGIGKQVLEDGDELLVSSYDNFMDPITFFEQTVYSDVNAGDEVTFTLWQRGAFSDESKPAVGVSLEIDGQEQAAYKTDANGKVKYTFQKAGEHHISAAGTIDGAAFVRPYAKVTVKEKNPANDWCTVEFVTGEGFPKREPETVFRGEPLPVITMEPTVTVGGQLYRFLGWYKDAAFSQAWDFKTDRVDADRKLYAKYEAVPKRTVRFELAKDYAKEAAEKEDYETGDGVPVAPLSIVVNDGDLPEKSGPILHPSGTWYLDRAVYPYNWEFDGYYNDKACTSPWDRAQPITADKTVYVKWQSDCYHEIYKLISATPGKAIPPEIEQEILDQNSNRRGEHRGGTIVPRTWFRKETYPNDGHTFTGKEEGLWETKTCKPGRYMHLPMTGLITKEDVTVIHEMEFIPAYWVTIDADGASINENLMRESRYHRKGSTLNRFFWEADEFVPVRKGYTFAGWYKDPQKTRKWDFAADTVEAPMTLYAKMIPLNDQSPTYTVTFEKNGGRPTPQGKDRLNPITLREGQKIPVRTYTDIERPGYGFRGWYRDRALTQPWDFSYDRIAPDFGGTLYAKWERNPDYQARFFTVRFRDTEDKEIAREQQVEIGDFVGEPDYNATGYALQAGWYKDKAMTEAWDFAADVVDQDLTLYGKREAKIFHVTFASNGGSAVAGADLPYHSLIPKPQDPAREGYTFQGWFKDDQAGQAWNFATDMLTEDTTLYAAWKAEAKPDPNPPSGKSDPQPGKAEEEAGKALDKPAGIERKGRQGSVAETGDEQGLASFALLLSLGALGLFAGKKRKENK